MNKRNQNDTEHSFEGEGIYPVWLFTFSSRNYDPEVLLTREECVLDTGCSFFTPIVFFTKE